MLIEVNGHWISVKAIQIVTKLHKSYGYVADTKYEKASFNIRFNNCFLEFESERYKEDGIEHNVKEIEELHKMAVNALKKYHKYRDLKEAKKKEFFQSRLKQEHDKIHT